MPTGPILSSKGSTEPTVSEIKRDLNPLKTRQKWYDARKAVKTTRYLLADITSALLLCRISMQYAASGVSVSSTWFE